MKPTEKMMAHWRRLTDKERFRFVWLTVENHRRERLTSREITALAAQMAWDARHELNKEQPK